MGTVVRLQDHKPHISGMALCLACQHEWSAVAPTGTRELDCPSCTSHKGIFKGFTAPAMAWECRCGSLLFFVSPDGCMCSICGLMPKFPDGD